MVIWLGEDDKEEGNITGEMQEKMEKDELVTLCLVT